MISLGIILHQLRHLPLARLDEILQGQRPLIIAPHPDDESLGCGGLIAACCAAGNPPMVVILTDGSASHPGSSAFPPRKLAALREQEARRAMDVLGLPPENLYFMRYPDTKLPRQGTHFRAANGFLAGILGMGNCGLVFAPWLHDPHCDHEAAALIAQNLANVENVRLLSYCVWGWLRDPEEKLQDQEFSGFRLDISDFMGVKQKAIAAHESQYGGLITDSPEGFRLPPALLEIFAQPFEVFFSG